MEDKLKQNQVMDIQPPRQPEAAAPQLEPTQDSFIDNEVQEAPQEDSQTDNIQQQTSIDTPILAASAQPLPKSHAPVLAIVSALIISGVFAALTVYSFTNNDQPKDSTATNTAPQVQKVDAAKAADIDTLNSTIDQDLSAIDDVADYNDAAVSDTTLGL